MKYLLVKIRWDKNKDPRVQELIATIYLIGRDSPIGQYHLPPNIDFIIMTLQDNASYHANITSVMEGEITSEAMFNFDIPDLSTPLPVGHFDWEITKVVDVDESIFNQEINEDDEETEKEEIEADSEDSRGEESLN